MKKRSTKKTELQKTIEAVVNAAVADALAAAARCKQPNYPANHMTAWTSEEDASLVRRFDRGAGITLLASLHERTRFAIFMRLVRHGKINEANCYRLWSAALTFEERRVPK
jgi:hypothetical protein